MQRLVTSLVAIKVTCCNQVPGSLLCCCPRSPCILQGQLSPQLACWQWPSAGRATFLERKLRVTVESYGTKSIPSHVLLLSSCPVAAHSEPRKLQQLELEQLEAKKHRLRLGLQKAAELLTNLFQVFCWAMTQQSFDTFQSIATWERWITESEWHWWYILAS